MNKPAFLIFFMLSSLTGIIVLLAERMGIELSVFVVLAVSLFTGVVAAVFYAKRVKKVLKQMVASAKSDLRIYNLPYSSTPGMDDISSVVKLMITKARESGDNLSRGIDGIKKIMDSVDIGMLVVNRHGSVVYANDYMERFASLGKDLTGIYFLDIIRSYEAEALFNAIQSGSAPNQKDISLFTPEERRFSLRINKIEYLTDERCYLFTLEDITRIRKIEQIRQDFITNASHELKTPLTSIIGYLEALKDNYNNREFVDTAFKNAKRMQRIVDDMLVLSNADRGASEFNFKDTNISDVVHEVYELLGNEIEKRHQKFILNIPEEVDVIYTDREALFHILLNLIDNAVKYGNDKGEISVSASERSNEIEIVVRDTGIGIPSNELDRIFERFYTVDKARSRELGGTGLGLSIVKHFVLAHSGRIWVESTLNKGSAFHFTIPKKK